MAETTRARVARLAVPVPVPVEALAEAEVQWTTAHSTNQVWRYVFLFRPALSFTSTPYPVKECRHSKRSKRSKVSGKVNYDGVQILPEVAAMRLQPLSEPKELIGGRVSLASGFRWRSQNW